TAMLDIGLHRQQGPVSVIDIADRQDISAAYLEQLFSKLKRSGLLISVRGPGGGYKLALNPEDISVSRIIAAVGEGVDATRCHGSSDCQDGVMCLTHDLWTELSQEIDDFLSAITLASLIGKNRARAVDVRTDRVLIETTTI
ncbi:MAG: Rrf2 family transcriptional regulator, partial [Gammaproteobacteria bacterium]|nr:Rrf2 family transcriptional regulator [Gammaproteobacteria bacterium]